MEDKCISVLKKYFGYDSFRTGQREIIDAIISGKDAFAIMPTGAGKSICYQVPAMLLSGITIVISPLISLMQDQVKALNEAGIHAAFINSTLSENQIAKALDNAERGMYKIIYVAPERLESVRFEDFAKEVDISMVTVDEAHCISQWGQDFRPSYLKILNFIGILPKRPIVAAFTATATEEVRLDVSCILNLNNPVTVVTGFDRENLFFQVEHLFQKDEFILNYVTEHPTDSGIVYCATRKNVEKLYELLLANGVAVTKYHAGLSSEERKKNQDDFIYDRLPVVIATNAFGMGIDKSNVRFVIHYNMPQSMENYYQEAGRAGRDGEAAKCILLFSPQDVVIARYLLDNKDFSDLDFEDIQLVKERDSRRLSVMENYCRTTKCLRNFILKYFGENSTEACDDCGNCQREYKEVDMTEEAKQIINCVYELKGKYGIGVVVGTLVGANRAKLREIGAIGLKTYGALKAVGEAQIRELIYAMCQEGYLFQTEEQYRILKLGNKVADLKDDNNRVILRTYEEKTDRKNKSSGKLKVKKTDALTSAGYELFDKLRLLRTEIAREEGMPPYIVFSDKTLIDMCMKLPSNKEMLLQVTGVGENKYSKYGERFISVISQYVSENPGKTISMDILEPQDITTDVKVKKTRTKKEDFHLTDEQAKQFSFSDEMYVSEMKDEMNRIRDEKTSKIVTGKMILQYLIENQFIDYVFEEGTWKYKLLGNGRKIGIREIVKESNIGTEYTVFLYPKEVQKLVVDHFIIK